VERTLATREGRIAISNISSIIIIICILIVGGEGEGYAMFDGELCGPLDLSVSHQSDR